MAVCRKRPEMLNFRCPVCPAIISALSNPLSGTEQCRSVPARETDAHGCIGFERKNALIVSLPDKIFGCLQKDRR